MYYKPDWELAKKRMTAFWNGEIIDRCCVGVLAPRKSSKLPPFSESQYGPTLYGLEKFDDDDYESIKQWWVDPEENYKRMVLWFENTYFGGEAAPATFTSWGGMPEAAFFGSKPVFNKKSVWYLKAIEDWDTWKWEFDRDANEYWKQTLSIIQYLLEVGIVLLGHHEKDGGFLLAEFLGVQCGVKTEDGFKFTVKKGVEA